ILPATMPRVTDAKAHTVPRVGTRSVGKASGSVSQRDEAEGALHFLILTPRLAYEHTSGLPLHLTYLKPEAAGSLFPRLIDRNQKRRGLHFPCASHPCGEINLGVKRDYAIGVGVFCVASRMAVCAHWQSRCAAHSQMLSAAHSQQRPEAAAFLK